MKISAENILVTLGMEKDLPELLLYTKEVKWFL